MTIAFQTYLPGGYDAHLALYHSQVAGNGAFDTGGFPVLQGDTGLIVNGASSAALVFDAWTEVKLEIDLDADTLDISYGGVVFHSGAWDNTDPGANSPSVGGINWWQAGPNSSGTSAYIDDISLTQVPEPSSAALLGLGGLALILRRRK
ncbi:PEP-CTERM sorting domain-containing protein [Rubritalea profundi]|uniref:PEP-CTERM sorting domain-containing protein n=1 Tax=Rubritalea profundi TaxID=1658618 RepID=UPI001F0BA0AA|nr:PEP-CTERM sorting domain-containing protein [Rubritalea profundi]